MKKYLRLVDVARRFGLSPQALRARLRRAAARAARSPFEFGDSGLKAFKLGRSWFFISDEDTGAE